MSRTAIAIRHLAFEDLGGFAPVLARAGFQLRYLDIGVDTLATPEPMEADLLFVLGGPIGAYEDDRYPFLAEEIRILERRLAANRPTFGICLGAQLMARALGAKVYPGPAKEFGFKPITLTGAGEKSALSAFAHQSVLHWHGDTFDLPQGAIHLASTDVCVNQAFAYGQHALAVQFHPEAGGEGFERWLIGHTLELSLAKIDVSALRAENERLTPVLQSQAAACLETWLNSHVHWHDR
ncbi:glutamine amidotransferase [Beijerinckia indica]|uniref:Glutamine amidotransferase class-I n=1 Tax=Beijerinckia indica subsp. indica (strain ATCC 9039 / DSM 1715 / NCIMB 8712) TaxID=395963 RepID=B2IKL4_BEII9|nr:glutamine amidotransferase [Beijerinckia indica]ACB95053.1 glutamine amidotransferase class-I [Beijerinckia indica subsp. indica ATCC 9039]